MQELLRNGFSAKRTARQLQAEGFKLVSPATIGRTARKLLGPRRTGKRTLTAPATVQPKAPPGDLFLGILAEWSERQPDPDAAAVAVDLSVDEFCHDWLARVFRQVADDHASGAR